MPACALSNGEGCFLQTAVLLVVGIVLSFQVDLSKNTATLFDFKVHLDRSEKWAHVLCSWSKFASSVSFLNASLLHCSAAPFVYILELLQMKEEPAPPSSWFRHVGKLAFLAARPKHQNNGSGCVITLHTGEGCFNHLMSSRKQSTC